MLYLGLVPIETPTKIIYSLVLVQVKRRSIKIFIQPRGNMPRIMFENIPGPEVIKLFMLNSTEHEISTAHENSVPVCTRPI